jgi:pimeloyl-ACP methyl ester carboxylesterase
LQRLHGLKRGEGEPRVVLLHGFLGSHKNLGALVRMLPGTRFAIDLLGHGQSPPLPPNAGLETMASAVLDEIEQEVSIVGHSLGGRVALMMKRLGSIAPIILLDITPSPIRKRALNLEGVGEALISAPESVASRDEMRAHLMRTLEPSIVEWLLSNLRREHDRYRWIIDRQALLEFDRRAGAEDLWDTIDETITCIRGGRSPYVSDEDAARFEELGARVITLPEAGHFVHVDDTETVARLLVGQLTPSGSPRP